MGNRNDFDSGDLPGKRLGVSKMSLVFAIGMAQSTHDAKEKDRTKKVVESRGKVWHFDKALVKVV